MDMSLEILTTAVSDYQDSQRSARSSLESRSSLDSTSFPLGRTSMDGGYDKQPQPAYTRRFLSIDGRRGNALDIPTTARSLASTSSTLSSVSSTPHGSWALDASTELDSRVSGYGLYGSSAPMGSSMHAASNLLSSSSLPQPIPAGKRLQVIGRKAAAALGDIEAYWKSMYLE